MYTALILALHLAHAQAQASMGGFDYMYENKTQIFYFVLLCCFHILLLVVNFLYY